MEDLESGGSDTTGQDITAIIDLRKKTQQIEKQLSLNIVNVIERNENLDALSETAESIISGSDTFKKEGRKLKRKTFVQLAKAKMMWYILLILMAFLLLFFLGQALFG